MGRGEGKGREVEGRGGEGEGDEDNILQKDLQAITILGNKCTSLLSFGQSCTSQPVVAYLAQQEVRNAKSIYQIHSMFLHGPTYVSNGIFD